jgi:hypothetical protein
LSIREGFIDALPKEMKSHSAGPDVAGPAGRRRWFVVAAVTSLAAVVGALQLSGVFAGKVSYGRDWPVEERLSLEAVEHEPWDGLLARYVDELGRVDYAGWSSAPGDIAALDNYLALLSRADPDREASRDARLAFWINAYNALTIRGILREYPTSSIQDHVSRLGGYNIWRDLLLRVGDRDYSLGQIEHQVLRSFGEPRIHFAIVCASRGCPRLLNRAYTASKLEQQLQENARAFFADPRNLTFDASTSRLRVSPILKWYAADFGPDKGAMLGFLAPYLPADVSRQLSGGRSVQIEYLEYDWGLNDQGPKSNDAPAPPADTEE